MKRRRYIDEVRTDKQDDSFYEAMPVAERQYYRDNPVIIDREDDRPGLSGLALLALVIAAIIVFLMVAGALAGLRESGQINNTLPAPESSVPAAPSQ